MKGWNRLWAVPQQGTQEGPQPFAKCSEEEAVTLSGLALHGLILEMTRNHLEVRALPSTERHHSSSIGTGAPALGTLSGLALCISSSGCSPLPFILSFLGFPASSAGKESAFNAGDPSLIPGSGRSPGKGIGYPLQYSGLENFMDCIGHGVAKSQTWLRDFHFMGHLSRGFWRLTYPRTRKGKRDQLKCS